MTGSKIVLANGKTVESIDELFAVIDLHPVKVIRRIRAVPMDPGYAVTKLGRELLKNNKAEEVKQA